MKNEMDYESVRNFVRSRYFEVCQKEDMEQFDQTLKPMTVRLPQGNVALIDMLATELDLSRQEFLFNLIRESLQEAIETLAGLCPEEKRMEVYMRYLDVMTGNVGRNVGRTGSDHE